MSRSLTDGSSDAPSAVRPQNFFVRRRVSLMFVAVVSAAIILAARVSYYGLAPLSVGLQAAAIGCIVLGLFVRSWAAALLKKKKQLATEGPYSICRHPLYLGSSLMLIGFCVLAADPYVAAILCGVWAVTYPATVYAEEVFLAEKFPDEWPAYASRVPRLFPRSLPAGFGSVSWQKWLDNLEIRAILGGVLGIIAFEVARYFQ